MKRIVTLLIFLAALTWGHVAHAQSWNGLSYSSTGTTYACLNGGCTTSPPLNAGTLVYCSNCAQTTTCSGGGTGAFAQYSGGAWGCNLNGVSQAAVSATVGTLSATTGTVGVLNKVCNATSQTGADIGAQVNSCITALGTQGGIVHIAAGSYTQTTTIQCPLTTNTPIIIEGDGRTSDSSNDLSAVEGTTLAYTGSGDAVNQVINTFADQNFVGCKLRDLTLDGGGGTTDIGYHFGGTVYAGTDNVAIRSFKTAGIEVENGSAGMWTERYDISRHTSLLNNAVGIKFIQDSGGNASLDHGNIDIWMTINQGQVGIQVNNALSMFNTDIRLQGNLEGTTSATEVQTTGTSEVLLTNFVDNPECQASTSCVRFNIGSGSEFGATYTSGQRGGTFTDTISGNLFIDNGRNYLGVQGHFTYSQAAAVPTLTSCGTSPAMGTTSTDWWGSLTTGTGAPTSCEVVFQNSPAAWKQAPICGCQAVGGTSCWINNISTSAMIMGFGSGLTSTVVNWWCAGRNP